MLVEIKARFDEQANIAWARMLEQAGCHVVYGLIGLKTHCKLALVVRSEPDGIRRYVHVGTGNYHPTTARLYEDVGLLTADPELTADVGDLFNLLTGYSRRTAYESMMVAPLDLRQRMLVLIGEQAARAAAGRPARIVMKLNSLVDEEIIDALYEASRAGVRIDLVVRGICGLRPGVKGLSERIKVRSILGRFLEHSRIYRFGDGDDDEIWIGSADMMHRNLDRRVEVLVRVGDPGHRARLRGILELALADRSAWKLGPDGHLDAPSGRPGHTPPAGHPDGAGRPCHHRPVTEREIKLALPGRFALPALDLGGDALDVAAMPDQQLRATYYDTADLRMARHGVTLRYRTGEAETPRWTLKLPVGARGSELEREELNFEASRREPPAEIRSLLTALYAAASP